MLNIIRQLWRDEDGASAIEYGLIAALISVGIAAAATLSGTRLVTLFERVSAALQGT